MNRFSDVIEGLEDPEIFNPMSPSSRPPLQSMYPSGLGDGSYDDDAWLNACLTWRKQHAEAKILFKGHLGEIPNQAISGCRYVSEMWCIIGNYQSITENNKRKLLRDLLKNDDLEKLIADIDRTWMRLVQARAQIPDEIRITALLSALPMVREDGDLTKYGVATQKIDQDDNLRYDQVVTHLRSLPRSRVSTHSPTEAALAATQSSSTPKERGPACQKCLASGDEKRKRGATGHNTKDCFRDKTCEHCGRIGHISRVCYDKRTGTPPVLKKEKEGEHAKMAKSDEYTE
ncbi:hypothetical protein HDU67_005356, partial [Dinochytrium kinnereticum]